MSRLGRAVAHRGARYLPAPPLTRNPDALGAWAVALGSLTSVPARWLAIGGGLTEGQGAATRPARWVDTALATLRTAKSTSGGPGFVSAAYQVTGPDSPWAATYSTRAGSNTVVTTTGIGARSVTLSQPGGTGSPFGTAAFGTAAFGGTAGGGTVGSVTFTVTGNSVDLWYLAEPASGALSYTVDGGSAVTVSTGGTHAVRRIQGIPLGANGSHTVVVSAATGTVYVTGLTVYAADAGTGIHLYEAARVGATSATHASTVAADLYAAAALIEPDLVTIEVGQDDPGAGVTAEDMVNNLSALVSGLRALPKVPSIVLVLGYTPAPSAVPAWPDYAAVQRVMAAGDTALGLVDLSVTLPAADTGGAGLYRSGGRYPNDSGHAAIAAAVAGFLNVSVAAPSTASTGAFLILTNAA